MSENINWKILAVLFLAIFCSMLGAGLVVPLLPAYAHNLGASALFIGFIFAAFSLSRTIALPIFGRLSDLKGRKPFITYGLLAYLIASIAYIFTDNYQSLILIRALQGVTSAMILPVARAYAGEITPKGNEGRVMGIFNVSLYGGLSFGPVLGGAVKDQFGIKASFLSMGIVCFFGFLFSLAFLPAKNKERMNRGPQTPVRYRGLLSDRHIVGLFLFTLTYTMCVGTIWSFGPLLADIEFNMSSFGVGVIISASVLASAVLMAPMGLLADKLNKRLFLIPGGLISAFGMVFFYGGHKPWVLISGSVLTGVGGGIALPAIMAMGVIAGRRKNAMGSVMALLTMGHSMAMFIGPIIGGLIADFISLRLVFANGIAIVLLGTFFTLILTSGFQSMEKPSNPDLK